MIHLRARCHTLAETWTGTTYPIYDRSAVFCERWHPRSWLQLGSAERRLVVFAGDDRPGSAAFANAIAKAHVEQEMAKK